MRTCLICQRNALCGLRDGTGPDGCFISEESPISGNDEQEEFYQSQKSCFSEIPDYVDDVREHAIISIYLKKSWERSAGSECDGNA